MSGLIDHYVIKNDKGEYLQDIQAWYDADTPVWTDRPDQAWKYNSVVVLYDAIHYGGRVYGVITQAPPIWGP